MNAANRLREDPGKGPVPAVDRALRILELLAESPAAEFGVSEISRQLSLNKSTVHGILTTLSDHGFLERDSSSRRYRAGPSLHAVALALRPASDVTSLARPALEALLRESGETVFLAVMRDDHVTLVDKVESTKEMSITSPLGLRLPHSAGALGKVFHAWMDRGELRSLLRRRPLRPFTSRTVVDLPQYLQELGRVREAGVAYDDQEYLEGVWAVAAPIFDSGGRVAAAVLVVGPSARFTLPDLHRVGRKAREVGRSVSARLGALIPQDGAVGG